MLVDGEREPIFGVDLAPGEDEPEQALKLGDVGAAYGVDGDAGHKSPGGVHQRFAEPRDSCAEQDAQHAPEADEIRLELSCADADAGVDRTIPLGKRAEIEERCDFLACRLHCTMD